MDSTTTIPELVQFAGAWGVFGLLGVVLLAISIYFTLYYSDWQDRDPFAMLITILALTLCLSTAALFPVDIFLVSRIMDPVTGLRHEWATDEVITRTQLSVKIVYYVAYGLIVSFCFFWIPLSYFYFEELADEDQTMIQRLWTSFKYTVFFVLVACILLLTGLLMKPNRHEGIDLDWLRRALADLAGNGVGAMAFVAGILALVGMGVLACYAAPGLSLLPLHLLAGSKSITGKSTEARVQLAANRERQNIILDRYQHGARAGGNQALSDRDRQAIGELAQEELLLEHRASYAQRLRDSWFHQCQWLTRPFEVALGLASTALSVLLVGSMLATSIGQTTDDICGAPCGYIFSGNLPNPLNLVFARLSSYLLADYVLIVAIILYMFSATTKGIITIGIRLLWVNLYKFRRAATQPQGLLAATMLLLLSLVGLSYSLTMSIAPEFSMFGYQKYCNHTVPDTGERDCTRDLSLIVPCHIGAPSGLCVATVTSVTVLQFIVATPSLGVAFFYLQWFFLAVFFLGLVFNLLQGCIRGFGVDPLGGADDDDLEELEARRLLSGDLDPEDGARRARRRELMIPDSGAANRGQRYGQRQGPGDVYRPRNGQSPASSYGATGRAFGTSPARSR